MIDMKNCWTISNLPPTRALSNRLFTSIKKIIVRYFVHIVRGTNTMSVEPS